MWDLATYAATACERLRMTRRPEPPDADAVRQAVLDLFVYAPIGFVFEARDVIPKLAERGRNQVTLARLFGRYAVQRGQVEADRIISRNRATAAASSATADAPPPETPVVTTRATPRRRRVTPTEGTLDDTLAIPGYDSLSASQVVPRLDALRPDELDAVRRYEIAHRGRRTILNRIAQLQA